MSLVPQLRVGTGARCRAVVTSFGFAAAFSRGVAAAALAAALGCAGGPPRQCAPHYDDVPARPPGNGEHTFTEPAVYEQLARRLQMEGPPEPPPGGKKLEVLALSGGGKYGAFSAGVLAGWREAGNRPNFDLVTGVSTGSIVALYAYLGPNFDPALEEFYTTVTSDQIYRKRYLVSVLWSDSIASSAPLKKQIDRAVDANMLAAVAAAHATGRRLFLATTNLDAKRLTVWDMGAIAGGPDPNKLNLFRDVLLASCSVPGEFSPVPITVTINGKQYTELHADGGITSEVFVRLTHLPVSQEQLKSGPRPLAGSCVHVIIAGKLYADRDCVKPKLTSILGTSVSSLIYAMTQNDLVRIFTLALLTGMDYRFAALRDDFVDNGDALDFNPKDLRVLFEEGRKVGRDGAKWRKTVPGVLAKEQIIPRIGTNFPVAESK